MAVASAFAQLQCFTGGCVYKKSSTIYWCAFFVAMLAFL